MSYIYTHIYFIILPTMVNRMSKSATVVLVFRVHCLRNTTKLVSTTLTFLIHFKPVPKFKKKKKNQQTVSKQILNCFRTLSKCRLGFSLLFSNRTGKNARFPSLPVWIGKPGFTNRRGRCKRLSLVHNGICGSKSNTNLHNTNLLKF